jgi:hypothetical protein
MVPWDHAKLRGGERGIPHRSCRQAECLTDEAEKRLIVERLHEKGKRAAFERGGANRACFPAGHHNHFCAGRRRRSSSQSIGASGTSGGNPRALSTVMGRVCAAQPVLALLPHAAPPRSRPFRRRGTPRRGMCWLPSSAHGLLDLGESHYLGGAC